MKKLMLVSTLLLAATTLWGQNRFSGRVTDGETEVPIYGANVIIESLNKLSATDRNGEFLFKTVPSGTFKVVVRMIGYETIEREINFSGAQQVSFQLAPSSTKLDDVVVTGTRATENTPTTYTNVSAEEIEKQNAGQDLPFLLNWTPSVVTTSDAGAGVGYTGIRIRGTDPTRINVTVNGIPINDSESQGTFWVNMPDFASSVSDIQIQRGVGTSTNGAGAFGASINILTNGLSVEPKATAGISYGSYNTKRFNATFSTGLMKERWAFEGRLSKIQSDGYVDRASSDLKSYYLSGGYFGDHTSVKLTHFSGKEVTYQSWYGVPEAVLEGNYIGILQLMANNGFTTEQADNLRFSDRKFNFYLYDNQVDNYGQDHYQLHINHEFNDQLNLNVAGHWTLGSGYFEEYRYADRLTDYGFTTIGIGGATITNSDLIRRRWLDNEFYGGVFDLNYEKDKLQMTFGGGLNEYKGLHFGEVIWMQYAASVGIRQRYYENSSQKRDGNVYLKANYQLTDKLNVYGDVQARLVDYIGRGRDNDQRIINFDQSWNFFNPKFGATYQLNDQSNVYASFAIGQKEPNRSDIIDATAGAEPEPEVLNNLEVGFRRRTSNYALEVNYYLMDYKNQLVLTGEVNDVGGSIRTNVPDSYRMGVELSGMVKLMKSLYWSGNVTFSKNKIERFEEVIFDYGPGFDQYNEVRTEFEDTDISFSPNIVAGSQLTYSPISNMEVSFLSKYVGDQYLDNTSNENRKIDAYFVNDIRLNYAWRPKFIQEINLTFLVNNIFNELYVSNGYTFGYFAGQNYEVRENWYYPQAETNFLTSLTFTF